MLGRVIQVLEGTIKKLVGINDAVGASDNVSMRFEQAPKVFCVACRTPVFYLKSFARGLPRFATTGRYPARNDLVCPACGKYLCAFENGKPKIKTDRGWM